MRGGKTQYRDSREVLDRYMAGEIHPKRLKEALGPDHKGLACNKDETIIAALQILRELKEEVNGLRPPRRGPRSAVSKDDDGRPGG